jgi:hypothetical protein
MIRNVLTDIGGIGPYGVISVCLFFLVFSGAVVWAFLLRKPYVQAQSQLPLEDGSLEIPQKGNPDHEPR